MTRDLRRWIGAGLLGLVASLALLTGAQAGGWSVVVLDSDGALAAQGTVRPGEPFTVGFTVLQHGDKPVDGLSPRITLTPEAGGAPATFSAIAQGGAGHYVATISLPEPGVWRWEIDAFGPPSVMAPITVAAAPAPAAPAPAAMPVAVLAALTVVALGLGAVALRSRRPAPVAR
jgi:hypothetical protein